MAVKSIKGGYCYENSSRALAIVYIPHTQKDIRDKKGKENDISKFFSTFFHLYIFKLRKRHRLSCLFLQMRTAMAV